MLSWSTSSNMLVCLVMMLLKSVSGCTCTFESSIDWISTYFCCTMCFYSFKTSLSSSLFSS